MRKQKIYRGELALCILCNKSLFDGHSNKCPHKPITKGAYWFQAMYMGKDKGFKYTGDGIHIVPFPQWCEYNKNQLKKIKAI